MSPRPRHFGRQGDAPAETPGAGPPSGIGNLDDLLRLTARGDDRAFASLYDALAARVFGLARQVVRDPAQAEEVAQEAFLDVWRTATKYDSSRASASTWVLTIAHRRAVDRVRSAQASSDRETRLALLDTKREFDEVAEEVESRIEAQQVRHCLGTLTDLQRESVTLAYYNGHTYAQVATLLSVPLGTIKTRLRDGLIRLRDCLGVTA
jgi:RNA polymerase sigma-70 factor (ECF subfamily)